MFLILSVLIVGSGVIVASLSICIIRSVRVTIVAVAIAVVAIAHVAVATVVIVTVVTTTAVMIAIVGVGLACRTDGVLFWWCLIDGSSSVSRCIFESPISVHEFEHLDCGFHTGIVFELVEIILREATDETFSFEGIEDVCTIFSTMPIISVLISSLTMGWAG